ncbi:unnamed protein product [Calicophoron daubneyi]|uniref:Intraflagellar transport protein 57 n=1 Tax=Calicophoron daubneyi TaxID=300641 RepID=A0AAV2TL26_CALDB
MTGISTTQASQNNLYQDQRRGYLRARSNPTQNQHPGESGKVKLSKPVRFLDDAEVLRLSYIVLINITKQRKANRGTKNEKKREKDFIPRLNRLSVHGQSKHYFRDFHVFRFRTQFAVQGEHPLFEEITSGSIHRCDLRANSGLLSQQLTCPRTFGSQMSGRTISSLTTLYSSRSESQGCSRSGGPNPTVMSSEKQKTVGDTGDAPPNPYALFVHMEKLSEKLKLLNYERDYCRTRHQKPISRHYFAIQTNPGEQFYGFTALAAWLIVKANGKIDPPQEYDDPNATIATILDAVRELGHAVEFPPSKLKSGCGDHCIEVLSMLADSALSTQGHHFALPNYPEEEKDELDVEEGDSSAADDDICEWRGQAGGGRCSSQKPSVADLDASGMEDYSEEEEDDVPDVEALRSRGNRTQNATSTNGLTSNGFISPIVGDKVLSDLGVDKGTLNPAGVLETSIDPSDWQLEVERVLPQLRITIRSDAKDWRAHLEEMRRYQQDIDKNYADAKGQLTRLHDDLTRALDKINSREKYVNSQLEPLLNEYKSIQDSLTEVTMKYRDASGGITERSRTLAEISEELERVKNEMDERGSSMTDGSPVVRIKQAIQRLKSEMTAMDIRTGVLEHILLRTHLRLREDSQKPLFSKEIDSTVGGSTFVY